MDGPLTHQHLHHHVKKIKVMIVIALVILAAGEFYLYRQQMQIKTMVSEGLMQLKEEMRSSTTTPSYAPAK